MEGIRSQIAEDILDTTRRLYARGLNSTLSGNISARVDDDRALLTPSALDKVRISASELSLMQISTETLLGGPKQTSEYQVHTHIYKAMPEINAVVHPHPQYSLAMVDAMGRDKFIKMLKENDEEFGYYVGSLASLQRMPAGSVQLADAVATAVKSGARVVIMEGHGTVGVGKTMQVALSSVESLEHMAQKIFITEMLRRQV